jgi:hypothetical protein
MKPRALDGPPEPTTASGPAAVRVQKSPPRRMAPGPPAAVRVPARHIKSSRPQPRPVREGPAITVPPWRSPAGAAARATRGGRSGGKTIRIQSFYYASGGWVMKGATACEKHLLRRDPLEQLLLDTIQERLQRLVSGEGERLATTSKSRDARRPPFAPAWPRSTRRRASCSKAPSPRRGGSSTANCAS